MLKFFLNRKKLKLNCWGSTLIELMMVIAIMGILSSVFYVTNKPNRRKQVEQSTQELLANLRQMRNMAAAKTVYKFAGVGEVAQYPVGGYGLAFDGTAVPAKYFLYADKGGVEPGYQLSRGDEIIGAVINLPSPTHQAFELADNTNDGKSFYFSLVTAEKGVTDIAADDSRRFIIRLRWPGGSTGNGYEGIIRLGEQTSDGSILANFGYVFGEYIPPANPQDPPPRRDPWDGGL